MKRFVLALLLTVGCGGGDDGYDFIGDWTIELSDGCACATSFGSDGRYEIDTICELNSGAIGVEAEVGKFTADGNEITTTATHATCGGVSTAPSTVGYDMPDRNTLRIIFDTGALVFQRYTPSGGAQGVIKFGCYDNNDVLIESTLRKL